MPKIKVIIHQAPTKGYVEWSCTVLQSNRDISPWCGGIQTEISASKWNLPTFYFPKIGYCPRYLYEISLSSGINPWPSLEHTKTGSHPISFAHAQWYVFSSTYFLSKFCHRSSSLINLNNHLLSIHLFCTSILWIPSPSWSFGWHIISHLANMYSFLCWSLSQ
jgi:hypothetical protein